MPRRDTHHQAVVNAFHKDGWTIEDETPSLEFGERVLYPDLLVYRGDRGAIILEVKEFNEHYSDLRTLMVALAQCRAYRLAIQEANLPYDIYLVVPPAAAKGIIAEYAGQALVNDNEINIVVVDFRREEIMQWKPYTPD
jgi:hypothetical protein